MRSIYFDYNATTPLDPQVYEVMAPFLTDIYGNPSSIHHIGRRARVALDEARERVSSLFACKPSEVVFTSGGTESNNLAILGSARMLRSKGRHLITSAIEHHSVLHCFQYLAENEGFHVSYLPVDRQGSVHVEDLQKALGAETTLVSVMAANNETGVIQPVAALGNACREHGVLFHTDATQLVAKEPLHSIHEFSADLVTVCSHKIHGPKGAGALFVRSPLRPDPILLGGVHENEHRAGTENIASIIGFTEALERFAKKPVFSRTLLEPLTTRLKTGASMIEGTNFYVTDAPRLANTLSCSIAGCDSISILAGLDLEGVCASSGSACSAGSLEPSHVLLAMGVSSALANSFVRFSLGRDSTLSEVHFVLSVLPSIITRIRNSNQSKTPISRE
ncbi:MAG: cysteine desulfurase [Chloroflexi bacterium]|nr:cysteine desulfurase [Chloroflexota bacterium]